MDDRNVSKLSEHKYKKGKVVTPFNDSFGDTLQLSSWTTDRMPEYLWLALILLGYGREEGLKRANQILHFLSKLHSPMQRPKLSSIFELPADIRKNVYERISNLINPTLLAPLTVIYRNEEFPDFNRFFYNPVISVEERIEILEQVIKEYGPHQTNEATDLRYLAVALKFFGKIHISENATVVIDAIKEYPNTSHDNEKMRMYRPSIRSMEQIDFEGANQKFIQHFWSELGSVVDCNLMYLDFKQEDDGEMEEFVYDTQSVFKYLVLSNKEESISESPKFEVVVGSSLYAFKMLKEVVEAGLSNKILGRHAIRSMIEVYIMLKYLLKREGDKTDIWSEYQLYGASKYKMLLLKSRENPTAISEKSHISVPVLDGIVNEKRWEEFIDVDLRYFDQQGIREKCTLVGEKELYDFFYDYDTNFVHGFWGAVRESSMLICDNAAHRFHNVPDFELNQTLPSVGTDIVTIMNKFMKLISGVYDLPTWYLEKYEVIN